MVVDEKQLTEDILRLAATDVRCCRQCGRCSANCAAALDMDLLPHRVVWELNNGHASELLAAESPWKCLSCMACEERCPRGVSPARIMEALRLLQIRQQGKNRLAAESLEHYPSDMPQQLLVAAFRKYNK